jgi:hypothetical protein
MFFIECKTSRRMPKNPVKLLSREEYDMALDMVRKYNKPFFLFFREDRKMRALSLGKESDCVYLYELGLK